MVHQYIMYWIVFTVLVFDWIERGGSLESDGRERQSAGDGSNKGQLKKKDKAEKSTEKYSVCVLCDRKQTKNVQNLKFFDEE